jgi:hypothetical protein
LSAISTGALFLGVAFLGDDAALATVYIMVSDAGTWLQFIAATATGAIAGTHFDLNAAVLF